MMNWVLDEEVIMQQTENAIMRELECLLDDTRPTESANYWLDNRHNVFATISEDCGEKYLDIRLELYDIDEDWVGDLYIYDTIDISREALTKTITQIVKDYSGE